MSRAHLAPPAADRPVGCAHCQVGRLCPRLECQSYADTQAPSRPAPALSSRLRTYAEFKAGPGSRPWHGARYIPEIRIGDATPLQAFKMCEPSTKAAVVSYPDIEKSLPSNLKKVQELRRMIGPRGCLILSCTGADRALDRFSVEKYDAVARAIGADAVTTPDDYIYDCDNAYPEFQYRNLLRAKSRTSDLFRIQDRPYSLIGLAVGQDRTQQNNYMDFLARLGISDLAFPCGDYLKGGRPDTDLVDNFVRRCREYGNWAVLLGISSKRLLLRYGPPSFSNSTPCFAHAHHRSARSCALDGQSGAPANLPVDRCLGILRHQESLGGRWGA